MSLPFMDNRLCLLKHFLFAIVSHVVSSTSCFYTLLSTQLSKKTVVVAWKKKKKNNKKCYLFIFLHCLGTRFMKQIGTILYYRISPPPPQTLHFLLALEGGKSVCVS